MLREGRRVALALACAVMIVCGGVSLSGDASVKLGAGAIADLKPGDSYRYSVRVRVPASSTPAIEYRTREMRVVVTEVLRAGEAIQVKARLDKLPSPGWPGVSEGAYTLLVGAEEDKARVVFRVGATSGLASRGTGVFEIPAVFYGYPMFVSAPREGALSLALPATDNGYPTRYTARYDREKGQVNVTAEYFVYASEDDPQKGRTIEYWVKDKRKLEATVPVGQEASPMYKPGLGFPRETHGEPDRYNVRPVRVAETEQQVWDPGAAFPKKVTSFGHDGKVEFEATLVKVEHVPLPPPDPEAAPAAAPGGAGD